MRGGKRWRFGGPWMFAAPWMMGRCGPYGFWHEHDEVTADDIEALEEFQRDLEQAAADVAERIRRLKEQHSSAHV